jgi:hypothetical protein
MKRGRGYAAAVLALTAELLPTASPFLLSQHYYPMAGVLGSYRYLPSSSHNSRGTAATVGVSSTSAAVPASSLSPVDLKRQERKKLIRKEGGLFAFDTKYGALNPFAIYYGLTSILLGIPWFIALNLYQLFRVVTFGKIDTRRQVPIFLSHCWGVTLMKLTRCYPKMENMDVLKQFYKR